MSHDHHDEHHDEGPQIDIKKSKSAFSASFWFVLIIALLFIAALNFVNVMSQPEEGHGGGHEAHTEAPAHGTEAAGHEAASHEAAPAPAAHEEAAHEGAAEGHSEEHH